MDVVGFARKKVEPMVRGLFSRREQETVLDVLGRSVVFVSPITIKTVLKQTRWLSTAWHLANLYLASCGAGAPLRGRPTDQWSQRGNDLLYVHELLPCGGAL